MGKEKNISISLHHYPNHNFFLMKTIESVPKFSCTVMCCQECLDVQG